jgi:hypothetical protein
MNTLLNLFKNLWNALGCVGELLGYLLGFVSVFFQSRVSLAARLLAAESQLGMCRRASSGVTAGGLSYSAVGRLDQPALPSAVLHFTAIPS